jgi:predicted anti-sigma-YlaC factor YlaD
MNTCLYGNQISAYHDGELNPQQRASLEQHLASCAECQAELNQTRRLSSLLASAPSRVMSQSVRQNLYALAPEVGQGVYIRIAEWTTALAASILIAASAWIFYSQPTSTPAPSYATDMTPVIALDPPSIHDASDMPDDPKMVDWVTVNLAAGQNP